MGAIHLLAAANVTVGGYVNLIKLVPAVLVLLLWARFLTWADKDAVVAHMERVPLNMGMLSGMVVAYGCPKKGLARNKSTINIASS
jgi:hypothetical protein